MLLFTESVPSVFTVMPSDARLVVVALLPDPVVEVKPSAPSRSLCKLCTVGSWARGPSPDPAVSVNCVFKSPMSVLKSVTNWLMAVDAAVVSGATVRLAWVPAGLTPSRFNVRPGITPVTVFEALVMAIPFTVSAALRPWFPCVNPKLPEDETVKAPALPEVLLTIDS